MLIQGYKRFHGIITLGLNHAYANLLFEKTIISNTRHTITPFINLVKNQTYVITVCSSKQSYTHDNRVIVALKCNMVD
jgi:hypothetical protein